MTETLDGGDTTGPPLDPLLRRLNLDPDDFPALEAFLGALDDSADSAIEPSKVPSGLTLIP